MDSAGRVTAGSDAPRGLLAPRRRPGFRGPLPGLRTRPAVRALPQGAPSAATPAGRSCTTTAPTIFPPYIVIFLVGHVVGYGILLTECEYDVPLWLSPDAVAGARRSSCRVALLQPVKGAVVGLQ